MNKTVICLVIFSNLCWAGDSPPIVPMSISEPLLELPPDLQQNDSMNHVFGKIVTWNLARLKKSNPRFAKKLDRVERAVRIDASVKTKNYTFGTKGDLKTRTIKSELKFKKIKIELCAKWPDGAYFETIYKPCGLDRDCGVYFGQQKRGTSLIGWRRSF